MSEAGGQVLFLDRVAREGLSEEATLKQRHKLYQGVSQSMEGEFQAEGPASAKALR